MHRLKQRMPSCTVTVACESWQIKRMQDWKTSNEFWSLDGVKHLDGFVEPGVRWEKLASAYDDGSLLNWHHALGTQPALIEADLVLSDNLPQILHHRKDALLMGSFLWSDILGSAYADHPVVKAFVREEEELLQAHRPHMICVGDMVMDRVNENTKAVKMPWFCTKDESSRHHEKNKLHLALLGGATESLTNILLELARELVSDHSITVYLPAPLLKETDGVAGIKLFDFSPQAFRQMNAIVCRPGIGTLTDCVCYGLPVIALLEPDNVEMAHNARRVESLGIGVSIDPSKGRERIKKEIEQFLNENSLEQASEKISRLEGNGIDATAEWLIQYFNRLK